MIRNGFKDADDYPVEEKIVTFDGLVKLAEEHYKNQTCKDTYREDPDSQQKIYEVVMGILHDDIFERMSEEQKEEGIFV